MKIKKSIEIIKEQGLQKFIRETGKYLFFWSPISPFLAKVLGDRLHHKIGVWFYLGYLPNIKNPRSMNEKLLHMKLYTNSPKFREVEDKLQARDYVRNKLGDEILPELYHVTENPEEIPFDELPEKFVIKPTHLSDGKVIICTNKKEIDEKEVTDQCNRWLDTKINPLLQEYWTQRIPPKIIVEEFITENGETPPPDYKFFCFDGKVEFIRTTVGRMDDRKTKRAFYDTDWSMIDVQKKFEMAEEIKSPHRLDDMIEIAEGLGEGFAHIRVDLYACGEDEIYFGEMTLASGSGKNPYSPQEFDFEFGEYWTEVKSND